VLSTGGAEDGYLVGSFDALARLYGQPGALDLVEYSVVADAERLPEVADALSAPGVSAKVVKRLASSDAQVRNTLSTLLLLVSAVVLAITMITVATTMMAVVGERQTEIALRKALGASDAAVRTEFMVEESLLGASGGLLGALAGLGVAAWVSQQVFGRALEVFWPIVPVAVLASVGVTVIAGYWPVRRAATVSPAVVLRGE
jgi:putative ABC transport system permease protein